MLSPDSRALLLDALRPPAGWVLDHAVATTFTLDLETALTVPLSFAGYALRETPDPVEVLDAIRSSVDKIDIFCQAGGIKAANWPSDLVGLLERAIHPVPRPRPGRLFHPKVWVVRFLNRLSGEIQYRCLILSRNLTQDRSWDMMLRLDSDTSKKGVNSNNYGLHRFVAELPTLAGLADDHPRSKAVMDLSEELRKVWWEFPEDVTNIAFWPFGLLRMRPPKLNDLFSGYRHLIVSPFLSAEGVRLILASSAKSDLRIVSRADWLDRIDPNDLPECSLYTINPLANLKVDTETDTGTIDTDHMLGDLHAKLFVAERNRQAHVFVGSANATEAAFNGNVEMLCELTGGATRLGIDAMMGNDAPFLDLLDSYRFPDQINEDTELDLGHKVEAYLIDLAGLRLSATASPEKLGWEMTVCSDVPIPALNGCDARLHLAPLNRPADTRLLEMDGLIDVTFGPMAAVDLTPFLILTCTVNQGSATFEKRVVLYATLSGDPATRLDDILVRQIDTPEKFLRLLTLLLGLGGAFFALKEGEASGSGSWSASAGTGILELLVRSLAENPQALDRLGAFVSKLRESEQGRRVLPEGWGDIWSELERAQVLMKQEN